jgi:hypothetical protein
MPGSPCKFACEVASRGLVQCGGLLYVPRWLPPCGVGRAPGFDPALSSASPSPRPACGPAAHAAFYSGHHHGLSFPHLLPLLPQQAGCPSPTGGSSSPVRARRFPQRLWTNCWSKHWRLLGHSHHGLPRQWPWAALAGAAADSRGSRPSGVPGPPDRAAGKQVRQYGAEAAGSRGPRAHATIVHGCAMRHTAEAAPPRRPSNTRLTHERSQRYGLAAQRSADRSVQPRSHGRGAAGLPPPCAGCDQEVSKRTLATLRKVCEEVSNKEMRKAFR